MKQSFINLSDLDKKFLIRLFESPESSDSDIAENIGASKATVGRIGKKLRKSGLIQSFLPIVDLDSLGVDFFAVITFGWKSFDNIKITSKMEKAIEKDPKVVYFSGGESSGGLTHMLMVGFQNMPEYHNWMRECRTNYGENITDCRTFFIPAKKIIKQDYTGLIKYILKEESK